MTDFSSFASDWMNPEGPLWTLHQLHDLRTKFIAEHLQLDGKTCIDLACGAGLLTEYAVTNNANVYGYDVSEALLDIATSRASTYTNPPIYQQLDLESSQPERTADVIFACEIIEHLDRPIASFVAMLNDITNKNGFVVISSLNKTLLGELAGIWLTEHVLKWLPVGTHQIEQCISLNQLLTLMQPHFELVGMQGMTFSLSKQVFVMCPNTDIHYLCCFRKKSKDTCREK